MSVVIKFSCTTCKKTIAKGALIAGQIDIKCTKCKQISTYTASEDKPPKINVIDNGEPHKQV
jgi:phage FluMu protein Com